MARPENDNQFTEPAPGVRERRWWPLIAVTAANYGWQIPYAEHQYGNTWLGLPGLSIPLLMTGVWFATAVLATALRWRHGRKLLAAFLTVEVAFYAIHNSTGAFGADLSFSNPVLLMASLLGYASATTAVVYLVVLFRDRRRTLERPGPRPPR